MSIQKPSSDDPNRLRTTSRQQLAENYGLGPRTFYRRMKEAFGDRFDNRRVFLPKEVAEICAEFGHWQEHYDPKRE